jgi:hypothetical protein
MSVYLSNKKACRYDSTLENDDNPFHAQNWIKNLIDHAGDDEATSIDIENNLHICSNIFSLEISKPEM